MLMHQMTRITRDKGALTHDDRLDALAMAVKYWVDQMAADADVKIRDRRDELFDMELEKFVAGVMGKEHVENSGLTWM